MKAVTTVSYKFSSNGRYTGIMEAQIGLRQGDPMYPYLFVIIIEYLHRIMAKMQENMDFNHHAKCEKLKVTHLAFADDLLMFSRGGLQICSDYDESFQQLHEFYRFAN
ncbi:unnamed protein product [Vicia faba]|uniref:Reverse transcriptase domain-containing protein n=1 Tax=Vicia faba TaxID=3906 RepID=A0AAV0YQ15_VICFA|nr:unnamed protein product [Vicia faba]